MLPYYVFLKRGKICEPLGVAKCDFRVHIAVRGLAFDLGRVVLLAVVVEQVVQKTGSCRRTCIQPEFSAYYIAVV